LGNPQAQVTWDPLTGRATPTSWSTLSDPAWQRVAK
jgi:hypothetical protein